MSPHSLKTFSSSSVDRALLVLLTAFTAAVRPSLAAKTASPRPLANRSLPKDIKTANLSSWWCFVVKSLTLRSVLTFFSENLPDCTAS